jgi:hypothetical protein
MLEKPAMAIRHVVAIVGLAAFLAGCGSIGAIDIFKRRDSSAQLPPPPQADQTAQGQTPVDPSQLPPLTDDTQVAGLPPGQQPLPLPGGTTTTTSTAPAGLGRTDLLGGWTITSGSDSCQLFMTLTSWTGGYRATTRGCNSDFLKSISAWNLSGTQVVFASMSGSAIAHLQSNGLNRFAGTADSGGTAVTFFR